MYCKHTSESTDQFTVEEYHTDGTLQVSMFAVHVHTKPVYGIGVHKTSLQHGCTENQFTVQVYTKPAYSTSEHKTSYSTGVHKTSLQYRCTQNKFTAQVNIKLFFITAVYETRLEYTL